MNDTISKPARRRWISAGLLLGAAALLVYAVYRPRALPVEVASVASGTFAQVIEEDGQLRIQSRYVLTAPTQATLLRPRLKVGDRVKAGEVLLSLEPVAPQLLDARTRGVLQQRVGSADAARQAAAAQVQRARTALAQATLEAERATRLAQENFIAPAARDQAALASQSARQALAAAQAALTVADYGVAEARAALARAEPTAPRAGAAGGVPGKAGGRWDIRSPVDGQVLKVHQDSAVTVAAGQALLDVGDTAALEAVIDVLSGDAARIPLGAAVQLTQGSAAPALAGRVARVEPVAFTKLSALGIEEQRVHVIVALEPLHPDPAQATPVPGGDGYRVDARITVASHPGVLLVPTAALVRDGPQWRVFVVADGHARARQVRLHARNAEVAWLQDGLRAGERVVLYPGSLVTDGQAVQAGEAR